MPSNLQREAAENTSPLISEFFRTYVPHKYKIAQWILFSSQKHLYSAEREGHQSD